MDAPRESLIQIQWRTVVDHEIRGGGSTRIWYHDTVIAYRYAPMVLLDTYQDEVAASFVRISNAEGGLQRKRLSLSPMRYP